MLTPQEVSTHAFSKAVMGGYNMAMVDEFLDELTDDYTALYKENAALKAKMKVLVEKVEDYRATEDSMRATLLTAQKMADSIVHEAEAKRDEILAQAEASAKEKIGQLRQEVEAAENLRRQLKEMGGIVNVYFRKKDVLVFFQHYETAFHLGLTRKVDESFVEAFRQELLLPYRIFKALDLKSLS